MGRRRFGMIRALKSGRWQVRYTDETGTRVGAPQTFNHRASAEQFLAHVQSRQLRRLPVDPAVAAAICRQDQGANVWRPRRRITSREARDIADEAVWRCHLCLGRIEPAATGRDRLSIDHVVPVSLGGGDERANLAPSHWRCNLRRRNTPIRQWVHRNSREHRIGSYCCEWDHELGGWDLPLSTLSYVRQPSWKRLEEMYRHLAPV